MFGRPIYRWPVHPYTMAGGWLNEREMHHQPFEGPVYGVPPRSTPQVY